MKLPFLTFLFALFFLQFTCLGQQPIFSPDNKHQIGFGIGTGFSKVTVKAANPKQEVSNADSILKIHSEYSPKLDVILVYQYNFNSLFSIRPTFGMVLNEGGKITFERKESVETIKIQGAPLTLAIPVAFKLSRKNFAPFVLAGPSFMYQLPSPNDAELKLPLKRTDIQLNIGAGVDIKTNHFIVSPELRFSSGLTNIKPKEDNLFSQNLKDLHRKAFTFTLIFRE